MRNLAVVWTLVASAALGATAAAQTPAPTKTRNVVLIVTDGLRWQELFAGADSSLLAREPGGVEDTARLRRDFWRPDIAARRRALLPWMWDVVAREGQIFGNRTKGSVARVTNGLNFSYPGYNEMLVGSPDPRIDRNEYGPNPNVTVFEWLGRRPGFTGRVAAFGTWDVFAEIFNRERSRIFVRAGWEPLSLGAAGASAADTARRAQLERVMRTTSRLWDNNMYDALLHEMVMEYVRARKPRALYIGYGETDEWAHTGRYDMLLRSARQVDGYIRELWDVMQRMPEYRGSTTFIITTDHGRGDGPTAWRNHGKTVSGAEDIWIAVIGPDTPALGERGAGTTALTQAQIAATVAALLRERYGEATPSAAPPITDVLGSGRKP